MKPVYEIKFLSNDDFDKLPKSETNGSDISDSLGFYNPFTNKVFIRHTASPELNKYLLDHEFEHLLEEKATDADENGIRHKKGKKFFKEIFMPLFTGVNLEQGSFSPLGIFDPKNLNPPKNEEQAPMQDSSFGGYGFGMPGGGDSSTPSFGSSVSPFSESQSSQSGLNQGLNSQSINPLADPYARYGQSSGRLRF